MASTRGFHYLYNVADVAGYGVHEVGVVVNPFGGDRSLRRAPSPRGPGKRG